MQEINPVIDHCFLLFGESKSGISSLINTIFQKNVAETGPISQTNPITKENQIFNLLNIGGQQIILIDTKGFASNYEINESLNEQIQLLVLKEQLQNNIELLTQKYKINNFGIIFTESLASDTIQLNRNISRFIQIFGYPLLESSFIALTKYENNTKFEEKRNQTRIEAIQDQTRKVYQQTKINLPIVKFQTFMHEKDKQTIDRIQQSNQQYEFLQIIKNLKLFPLHKIKEFLKWFDTRTIELYQKNIVVSQDKHVVIKQVQEEIELPPLEPHPLESYILNAIPVSDLIKKGLDLLSQPRQDKIYFEKYQFSENTIEKHIPIKTQEYIRFKFMIDHLQERNLKLQQLKNQ